MRLQVTWKILLIVFLLAFAVRLIALNQSLWLDEATSARVVTSYSFMDITGKFSVQDFHPPLHYLLLNVWAKIFGDSEVSLRFPSVLFSLLSGWAIYLLGKELKDKRTGLYACIFFLFNPLVVYYSQEARMYMMVTAFVTFTAYYIVKVLRTKKIQKRDVMLGNIFIALSLFTFYGSIFFILSAYIYFLIKKERQKIFLFLPGFILASATLLPLLRLQLANSREFLRIVPRWVDVLGKANLKNLLLIPIKFTMGRISFEPKPLYYTVAVFWTAFTFFVASRKAKRYDTLAFFLIVPIFLGFLFSFYKPLLQYFRFIYVLPFLSLLIALGSQNKPQRIRILIGFLFFTFVYLLNPVYHREDWRALAKTLDREKKVYMIPASSDPILYYKKDLTIQDIRDIVNKNVNLEEMITIIPYMTDIYGFDYGKALDERGYRKESTAVAQGLTLEHWRK